MTRFFLEYLTSLALRSEAIYILGDLFEAWIGDDDDTAYPLEIIQALKEASDAGASIYIQHGNRDFLLGEDFAARSGTRLLPDPYLLALPEKSFLLSHGDALCTSDTEYQAFRREVRKPQWQSAFLAKPLKERRALANQLREQSENIKKDKELPLMDIYPKAAEDLMLEYGYATLIHGHTHRPATHLHTINNITVERWVLADWHENYAEILVWEGKALRRLAL